ncbi:MAG: hypothetical protein EWV82_13640 [Microcystis aeruginosa Ma_AC_P_19900807_S299]|jgi:predicted RNase H-like HicB family nuclease|nr:MAG: hypothetical protein EWV82_13640 [Microcystis aeruginosa Ma_AC_P_19900807_S299]
MVNQISIVISKNPDGYSLKSPELAAIDYQDSSLEGVLNRLKDALETHLMASDISQEETGESILKIVDRLNLNFPEEEIDPLPSDGAEEHDHYLYGSPKKRQ